MLSLKIKKGDAVIIAAVLCIAVVLFVSVNIRSLLDVRISKFAVIKIPNGDEKIIPLDKDDKILLEANGYMLEIQVKEGEVWVSSSDCPDKSCVRMGAIGKGGRSFIACVPAGVYITCEGDEGDGPDAVVG